MNALDENPRKRKERNVKHIKKTPPRKPPALTTETPESSRGTASTNRIGCPPQS